MSSSIGSQEIGQIMQQILPLASDSKLLNKYKNHFDVLFRHLSLNDPPVPLGLNQEALTAFGLQDFVNLILSSGSNQARQLIVEFVSFSEHARSSVRQQVIEIKEVFKAALKLPPSVRTEAPADVDPAVLQATALKLMETYVLPYYNANRYPKNIRQVLIDIEDGKAHKVDFAQLIYEAALKEIETLISEATRFLKRKDNAEAWKHVKKCSMSRKMVTRFLRPVKYKWSCKFSPFWHRLLEEEFGTEAFAEHVRTLCIQQEAAEENLGIADVNIIDEPSIDYDPPPDSPEKDELLDRPEEGELPHDKQGSITRNDRWTSGEESPVNGEQHIHARSSAEPSETNEYEEEELPHDKQGSITWSDRQTGGEEGPVNGEQHIRAGSSAEPSETNEHEEEELPHDKQGSIRRNDRQTSGDESPVNGEQHEEPNGHEEEEPKDQAQHREQEREEEELPHDNQGSITCNGRCRNSKVYTRKKRKMLEEPNEHQELLQDQAQHAEKEREEEDPLAEEEEEEDQERHAAKDGKVAKITFGNKVAKRFK